MIFVFRVSVFGMNQLSFFSTQGQQSPDLTPSRSVGLARLEGFLPRAGRDYAANRNFDLGPDDRSNVSLLSPWLRHRLINEEEVLRAVRRQHRFVSAEKFIQEVMWRAYFKGWLEQHPDVWTSYRADVLALVQQLESDEMLNQNYMHATSGVTGIACFDAFAQELVATGYLHNHARMWFASIWIFTLGLPWQLGADFFYRHLLDGDPASNTLSWRWVAGLHTKGKTYLARPDNIATFTKSRFGKVEGLATQARALRETQSFALKPLYPAASIPPAAKYGLLITEEDCQPETLGLPHPPEAILGLTSTKARSPMEVGGLATAFATGAVADALARAGQTFSVAVPKTIEADDWGMALADWAMAHDINIIATSYAPVGPVSEKLAVAQEMLAAKNIELVMISRAYDRVIWPHATKGFFAVKAQIPAILSTLGIGE